MRLSYKPTCAYRVSCLLFNYIISIALNLAWHIVRLVVALELVISAVVLVLASGMLLVMLCPHVFVSRSYDVRYCIQFWLVLLCSRAIIVT